MSIQAPGGWEIDDARVKEQLEWAIKNRRANCYMQLFSHSDDDRTVVCVTDLYDETTPTVSVTNDAEFVVAQCFKLHGDVPIIYRDTEGNWDELRHREGHFACFRSLDTREQEEAIIKVLALHERDASQHRSQ